MPPKKPTLKRESEIKDNDQGNIQRLLLQKDLELNILQDKLLRLEKRSQHLVGLNEKQQADQKETKEKLQDIIAGLTSEVNAKYAKAAQLEKALVDLREERTRTVEALRKDLDDLRNNHKFLVEDLRLRLTNAQMQLRDIDEFRSKKTMIEEEIVGLKELLDKEKEEHQEALNNIERAALQEKERLKKEMAIRIEETKQQMLQQMDEQLHTKTKRIIIENEQLANELSYHIRQTELLLQKNEKLIQENMDLHRQVLLAKEVEEDLARKNHMNQKTVKILVYKLHEKHVANEPIRNSEEEEIKRLICHQEQIQSNIHEETQERPRSLEPVDGAEEAMRFLYACLEDIETEKLCGDQTCNQTLSMSGLESSSNASNVNGSLDKLTPQERRQLLMNLLHTALSLRAVSQSSALKDQPNDRESSFPTVSIEDILQIPVEELQLQTSSDLKRGNNKLISIGLQTQPMGMEDSLGLLIGERVLAHTSQ